MKVLQFAALFGGTVVAVLPAAAQNVERALSDITTTVVLTTSTYTVTECASDAVNCPASATVVQTSTTVVSVTTTICSLTSTPPGALPPVVVSPTSAGVSGSILPPSPTASNLPPGGDIPISFSLLLPTLRTSSASSEAAPFSSSGISVSHSTDSASLQTSALPTEGPPTSGAILTSVYQWPSGPVYSPPSGPNTNTDATHTSFDVPSASPSHAGPSSGYAVPPPVGSLSLSGSGTASLSIAPLPSSSGYGSATQSGSIPPVTSAAPTDSVAVPSGSSIAPSHSGAVPSGSSASPTNSDSVSPGTSAGPTNSGSVPPVGPVVPTNTQTDAIPTSPLVASSVSGSVGTLPSGLPSSSAATAVPSSSNSAAPSISTISGSSTAAPTAGAPSATLEGPSGYPTGAPPGSIGSVSGTSPAATSASSGYAVPPPAPSDASDVYSTTRITSYLTHTLTSVITAKPSSSQPGNITATETDAASTDHPSSVSALPSGSGYPLPSNGTNGTVVAPTPSRTDIPFNVGQTLGAAKGSFAAIVVAVAFALFI